MRRQLGPAVAVVALLAALMLPAWENRPTAAQEVPELRITSSRYIVIDADTGEVFAARGAHDRVAIASITKVFTAIAAIELAPPDTPITTTPDDQVSSNASQMGFGPGETFTLDDLIYGMMLPSGNDAARAIARTLGAEPGDADGAQSLQRFMDRLNARIADMGLSETHLVNPDGWGVPNHHSSAHDVAAFTRYALRFPRFTEAISTETYETSNGYWLSNTNRMLGVYPGLIGGKTGIDDDAGYCLVEIAERDGSTMIAVTLDGVADNGDWYDDQRVLLDYAFDQKAARVSVRGPITGEIVRFRDPDAAVIERVAQAGASVGAPGAAPPPIDGGVPTAVPLASEAVGGVGGAGPAAPLPFVATIPSAIAGPTDRAAWPVPFAIAAALIGAGAVAAQRGASVPSGAPHASAGRQPLPRPAPVVPPTA